MVHVGRHSHTPNQLPNTLTLSLTYSALSDPPADALLDLNPTKYADAFYKSLAQGSHSPLTSSLVLYRGKLDSQLTDTLHSNWYVRGMLPLFGPNMNSLWDCASIVASLEPEVGEGRARSFRTSTKDAEGFLPSRSHCK